jgi:bis(5'-adenosyl)-triphosphatase
MEWNLGRFQGNAMSENFCPFCIRDELVIIFESAFFLAICNKFPIVEGHSLIIPKRHLEGFMDLNSDDWSDLRGISRRLIQSLLSEYETDSFDYALQQGVPAGGSIKHLHFHTIPRRGKDFTLPGDWYPELVRQQIDPAQRKRTELDLEQMQGLATRIRQQSPENSSLG